MKIPAAYTETRKRYAHLSQRYDRRWSAYLRRTAMRALDDLGLSGRERVLDVGCGTGVFAEMAHERFPDLALVGIDVTAEMMAVAREKIRDRTGTSFLVGVAEELPFRDACFDAVVSCNVLHHVRGAPQFMGECERVLRPGGRLVLVDWCRDNWHCRVLHYWLRRFDRSYVRMYRTAELRASIETHGLIVETVGRFLAPPLYGMLRLVAGKCRSCRHG